MSKQICTGCRAVVVNSKAGNNGIIVRVGVYIGSHPKYAGANLWAIDKRLRHVNLAGVEDYSPIINEATLERIDDDEQLGSWSAIESLGWKRPVQETV